MKRLLPILLILFFIGCATTSRVPIHKVVGSPTVRTKVVLLKNNNVDFAYQKTGVREFEAALLKEPISFSIKRTLGEKVDLVLITRKEVQIINSLSPEEITKIGQESDVQAVIVVEPLNIDYSEGITRKEDEVCVVRNAKVLVSAKVAETRRGEVVLAGVYEGKAKAKQCSKGIQRTDKLPSKDSLIVRALKEAASKFSKEFWSNL